jgi:hypothetical protein
MGDTKGTSVDPRFSRGGDGAPRPWRSIIAFLNR